MRRRCVAFSVATRVGHRVRPTMCVAGALHSASAWAAPTCTNDTSGHPLIVRVVGPGIRYLCEWWVRAPANCTNSGSGHPLIEKLMGLGTPLQISNNTPLNLKVCCCVPERPGHTSPPACPTPPPGPRVWRLLRIRRAPTTVRLWVTHVRAVAGLLPGAQLGMITAVAPTTSQPSSISSTVAS